MSQPYAPQPGDRVREYPWGDPWALGRQHAMCGQPRINPGSLFDLTEDQLAYSAGYGGRPDPRVPIPATPPADPEGVPKALERAISRIIQDACELPDRSSPDDQPEMLLITGEELDMLLRRHLGLEDGDYTTRLTLASRAGEREAPGLERAARHIEEIVDAAEDDPIGLSGFLRDLAGQVRDLASTPGQPEADGGWQPIKTTLEVQRAGLSVLVGDCQNVDQAEWEGEEDGRWLATGGKRKSGNDLGYQPTHWRALPTPPSPIAGREIAP